MSQLLVPAVFMRGGTSKGLFFHDNDLPAEPSARDAVLLRALGSPDPYGRQLDGMGGGLSSLSKAAIIGPTTRADADVDYTFAQVAVDAPVVDYAGNCGNLSAAVGPFAVDEGLCPRSDGGALVRIHNTNTGKVIHARFRVRGGQAVIDGDLALPGVPGTGAPVRLSFLDPGGSRTCALLPSGRSRDVVQVPGSREVTVSLVDAANPLVVVTAESVGLSGTEGPDEMESLPAMMSLLDAIRRRGGVLMGLAGTPEAVPLSSPKVAVVSAPHDYATLAGERVNSADYDLGVRMLSMERAHRAVTVTGALCLGVAARVPGTLVHERCERGPNHQGTGDGAGGGTPGIRIGSPSGVVVVAAVVADREGAPHAVSAALLRTARRLMQGAVALPRELTWR